jgi:hypothetical protein
VGVYRATRGEPVTVVVYPGAATVEDVYVSRGVLTDWGLEGTGQLIVVTVSPLEEKLMIALRYEDADRKVYLPLVLRDH